MTNNQKTARHTPGPWVVGSTATMAGTWVRIESPQDGVALAQCRPQDAALIAAAPNLSETLSAVLRTINDTLRHGLTNGQREGLECAAKDALAALKKAGA